MTEYTDHYGPEGPRTRGTVLVVPGRGETRATYARFGKRLAADAYRVRVDDSQVRRGALNDPVPPVLLTAAYDSEVAVPVLILVGDADPLADRDALVRTAKSQARARLSVVRGAHHDVLNDVQHRSVAAETVTFLETLRDGLVPVIAVESSAW